MAGAGHVQRQIPGLYQFLSDAQKLGPVFNKELRLQSIQVAKHLVDKAKQAATTEQEKLVAVALEARPDRIPTIRVKSGRNYVSKSRPNRRRKTKAMVIDIWFGAEFGGGKFGKGNPAPRKNYDDGSTKGGPHAFTSQFRPHRGRQGYFFYPTVRKESDTVNDMYAKGVDRAMSKMFNEKVALGAVKGIARRIA